MPTSCPGVFLIMLLVFLGPLSASAQKYMTAGGVRFGTDLLGFTVQQRILERTTVEAIALGNERQISGHLLVQQHFPLLGKRMNIYVGGGFHLGDHKEFGTYYGPDVIMGIEYKFNGLPLLLSLDIKPSIHLDHVDRVTPSTAFSLRYVFVKEPRKDGIFKKLFHGGEEKKQPERDGFFKRVFGGGEYDK